MNTSAADSREESDKSLLLVDDDRAFRNRLTVAMERRGYTVYSAESLAEADKAAKQYKPRFAILDMRLGDGNGLDFAPVLRDTVPDIRIVVLTGYGNIAAAVSAIKAGVVDFLAKPVDADDVEAALLASADGKPPPPDKPMSADRVRWEHIQRVYELCDRNVSETARRLNMHRRTLQRILAKRSPQ